MDSSLLITLGLGYAVAMPGYFLHSRWLVGFGLMIQTMVPVTMMVESVTRL